MKTNVYFLFLPLIAIAALLVYTSSWSLYSVQDKCNLLTNDHILQYLEITLPKRKPDFKNYTRQVCQKIENKGENLEWKLSLLFDSFIERGRLSAGVSFFEIIEMGINHDISKYLLKYSHNRNSSNQVNQHEQKSEELLSIEKYISDQTGISRFDALANWKGIQPQIEKILLLDTVEVQGSSAKASVIEPMSRQKWVMKWGDEVHTDIIGSRIFAELGFDVDHPYYFGKNHFVLVIKPGFSSVGSMTEFISQIHKAFKVNLSPFVTRAGKINNEIVNQNKDLEPYKGFDFIQFKEVVLEARPNNITRLGPIMSNHEVLKESSKLRGSLLAHVWIGNWDTKEDNTMLSIVKKENQYHLLASFNDLGASFGVRVNKFPRDLRVGLINDLPWEPFNETEGQNISFNHRVNYIMPPHKEARYMDLKKMAYKIALLDENFLNQVLVSSGLPAPISNLFLEKLLYRQKSILNAFQISLPEHLLARKVENEIEQKYLNIKYVNNGNLIKEVNPDEHPEGFINVKGRFRNYGW